MKTSLSKTAIIICGPTAVGKTSVALQLAQHYNTEIISADSRQCFKELNIGVARPSAKELAEVRHHFIASHSVQEEVTAASFEQFAVQKAAELFQQHDTIVMVGGTGLYIKAFCEGLDLIPEIPAETREKIINNYESKGMEWLKREIKEKDPAFYASGEIQNPQRMMRALEVMEAAGQTILSFRKGGKAKRDFNINKVGLELPREELVRNIDTRIDKMMEAGLLDEVKSLTAYKNLNALQTVGYTELFGHLEVKMTLAQAIEKIKTNTRQYAKRQMTWFKKDGEVKWFGPGKAKEIVEWLS